MTARSLPRYGNSSPDYAAQRLRGTVWEKSGSALVLYRGCLAFGRALSRTGVSANLLTIVSLLVAGAAGVAAAYGQLVVAGILVLASGAFDVLDGVVARTTGTVTRFGALLDSTVDRLADALPLVGLALYYAPQKQLVLVPVLAMVGGFGISYVRSRAEGLGASLPPLFMRRAERVILLTLSFLLGAVELNLSVSAPLTLLGIGLVGALNLVAMLVALKSAAGALAKQPEACTEQITKASD